MLCMAICVWVFVGGGGGGGGFLCKKQIPKTKTISSFVIISLGESNIQVHQENMYNKIAVFSKPRLNARQRCTQNYHVILLPTYLYKLYNLSAPTTASKRCYAPR